jgi:sterol desaturase/sphingolipid hydroxylase (fatty acid hydroxylase superfamily)
MDNTVVAWLLENYRWGLSLVALGGILASTVLLNFLLSLIPTFKKAQQLNKDTFTAKMAKPIYAANQKWNRKWSLLYLAVIFGLILPFCLTSAPTPLLTRLIDIAVILMFYDFFYYLTNRFLFHQSEFFGGPLVWMHAVHHQQHNPCRNDSSYIHPLEVAIGLGLYVASIFVLSRFMGRFDVLTIVITWLAFTEVNLHNHNLWETDRFPFRYLNYASKMHHNHHARFTGGNFATITLLYDWMFGTLDKGGGLRVKPKVKASVSGA